MDPNFDSSTHFLLPAGEGRPVPIICEHATGHPHWAVVDGRLVPFDEWQESQPKPPPGPARAFSIQADDASFRGTLEIS